MRNLPVPSETSFTITVTRRADGFRANLHAESEVNESTALRICV